jgi:hypothetical protein
VPGSGKQADCAGEIPGEGTQEVTMFYVFGYFLILATLLAGPDRAEDWLVKHFGDAEDAEDQESLALGTELLDSMRALAEDPVERAVFAALLPLACVLLLAMALAHWFMWL